MTPRRHNLLVWALSFSTLSLLASQASAESWEQYKFDSRHSGNAPKRQVKTPLKLAAAIALSDGVYTSPVLADNHLYIVDGSGRAYCIDTKTFKVVWQRPTRGGKDNCNNVSSPALAGDYLHFGTMAGYYYVLNRHTGETIKELDVRDPIFSAPAISKGRVYFVTLGSQVYALEPNGDVAWKWDFVREVLGFEGNRWSGEEWHKHKQGRVTWKDHFVSSRNLAVHNKTIVVPAGGRTVFLEDQGGKAKLRIVNETPSFHGSEYPACFGQSIGEDGSVYVQWHRRDNAGRVEKFTLNGDTVTATAVPGTETYIDTPGLMSFRAVSIRGDDI